MENKIKVGDKVRFKRDLIEIADEHATDTIFAMEGQIGQVVEVGGCEEGFWVEVDGKRFGSNEDEFEVVR